MPENNDMNTVKVGVIGCGAISGAYLGMAKQFPMVQISAVADLDHARTVRCSEIWCAAHH